MELMGGFFGLFFIVFLIVTWVPRNWQLLLTTPWQVYVVAIGLGLFGITIAYLIAKGDPAAPDERAHRRARDRDPERPARHRHRAAELPGQPAAGLSCSCRRCTRCSS
jgi:hypothetical protein